MMFQLRARSRLDDMSAISSTAHGSNAPLTCGMNSSDVPSNSPAVRERDDLVVGGVARRDHVPVGVVVGARPRRREAERAGFEALAEQRVHLGDFVVGSRAADTLRAHHDARRTARVANHEGGVDTEPAVDLVEVLGGGRPVPRHAFAQRFERHAFDPGEHPHQVLAVGGVVGERRDGEAAVPGERRGDAVERRRREGTVPEDLRVVVRVDVDEPGGDDLAGGVDGLGGFGVDGPDRGDLAVGDPDVGSTAGRSRSVKGQGLPNR